MSNGCGKSYRLCQKALAVDGPIILSFTHKAIQNVKSVMCEVYNNYESAKKCYTFDLFFCDHHGRDITALEGKTIFVGEYSMTPNKWMTKLYQAFTKYKLTIYMFGDTNQCDPVEPTDMFYNYFTSIPISEMCPRRVEMKYIEEYARYDPQTRDLLTKFLKSGSIKHQFDPPKDSYHNICYLNKRRRHVTQECCNRFTENKEYYEIDFKYQGHREKYKVAAGMPMLVTQICAIKICLIWSSITLTILRKQRMVILILFLMVHYSVTVNFASLSFQHFVLLCTNISVGQ